MSDSEYEEEPQQQSEPQATPQASQPQKPGLPQASQPQTPVKKNERGAGRKKGNKPGVQKVSEFQQSKLMSETFKEYTDMLIMLKKELEEQKKTLHETINSEETKHKKDVKNAVQEAKLAFARTLTRH
jgi:ribosomal protein S18